MICLKNCQLSGTSWGEKVEYVNLKCSESKNINFKHQKFKFNKNEVLH